MNYLSYSYSLGYPVRGVFLNYQVWSLLCLWGEANITLGLVQLLKCIKEISHVLFFNRFISVNGC